MEAMLISNIVECMLEDVEKRQPEMHLFFTGHFVEAIDDDYTWVLIKDNI